MDGQIATNFETLQERYKLTGAMLESLTDTVSKIAAQPAPATTTGQRPEVHSMETPQATRRPEPQVQSQCERPVGLFAAPYVRRFGEDITEVSTSANRAATAAVTSAGCSLHGPRTRGVIPEQCSTTMSVSADAECLQSATQRRSC